MRVRSYSLIGLGFCLAAVAGAAVVGVPNVSGPVWSTSAQPQWGWVSGGGGTGTYRHQLDGQIEGGWSGDTTAVSFTPGFALAEGPHTLYVQEKTVASGWSPSGSWTITVDTVKPTAPLVTGPARWNTPYPTWVWTPGGGGNGTYRFKLDNADLSSGATETTLTNFPARTYAQYSGTAYSARNDSIPSGGTFTAEAWVKADAVAGNHGVLVFAYSLTLGVSNGHLYYDSNGSLVQTSEPVIPTGVWTHVAVVSDADNWKASLYVNGEFAHSAKVSSTVLGSAITIGNNANGEIGWAGAISDVRVWDYMKTDEEIAVGMYAVLDGTETGLAGWWRLNDATSGPVAAAADSGPGNYDLFSYDFYERPVWVGGLDLPAPLSEGEHTLYVQERDAAGNWSASGSFTIDVDLTPPPAPSVSATPAGDEVTWSWGSGGEDGNGTYRYRFADGDFNDGYKVTTDTQLSIEAPPYLELTGEGVVQSNYGIYIPMDDFTFTAWVNPEDVSGEQVLFSVVDWNNDYLILFGLDDGHLKIEYTGIDDSLNPFAISVVSDTQLTAGQWRYVAATYDEDEHVARLFLDGQEIQQGPFQIYGGYTAYTAGGAPDSTKLYTGGIRDLRVWAQPLDPIGVNRFMWCLQEGGESWVGEYWRFDDMQGTTATGKGVPLYFSKRAAGIWHGTKRGDLAFFVQERDGAGNWSETGEATTHLDNEPPDAPVFSPIAGDFDITTDQRFTWTWSSGGGGNGVFWCSLNGGPWFMVEGTSWTADEDMPVGYNTLDVFEMDEYGNPSYIESRRMYVDPNWTILEITTDSLPVAVPGEAYSLQLEASGGTPPYTWYDRTKSYSVVSEAERLDFPDGTAVSLESDGDYESITLPWSFTFDGVATDTVDVHSTGLEFVSAGWIWINPNYTTVRNITYLFQSEYAVFEYEVTLDNDTGDTVHLEFILYPSGEILVQDYNTYNEEYYVDWSGYASGAYDWVYMGMSPAFRLVPRPVMADIGLTVSETGLITGTPTQIGEFILGFSVRDWEEESDSKAYSLQQWAETTLTLRVGLPAPVMDAEPAVQQGTSNTVSWTGSSTDGYFVECSTDPTFESSSMSSGWIDALNYEFTGLLDATYYYRVRGRDIALGLDGPWSNVVSSTQDNTAPIITRLGDPEVTVEVHGSYSDAGATAEDNFDGIITANIVTGGLPVNTNVVGDYPVTYDVTDAAGNPAIQAIRMVHVVDTTKPVITRSGDAEATVEVHGSYSDAGATAEDNYDGNITASIVTGGLPVNTNVVGDYAVTYDVTDAAGNPADQVVRMVHVVDTTKPVIARLGDAEVTVEAHGSYADAGATAEDNYDGDITANIVTGGLPMPTDVVGDYTVTYDVTDAAGNPATQVTRLVHVVDTTKPVITRSGDAEVTVEVHGSYTDAGATAEDNYDGDITADIVTGGLPVDTSALGDYTVTYDVTDAAGNPAVQVIRTVHVVDTTKPVIMRSGDAEVTVAMDGSYSDVGATAEDNYDGDITADIVTGGLPVDTSVLGDYTVTYDVIDAAGNPADQVTRTVHVVDMTKPVINRLGDAEVTVEAHGSYADAGATAEDDPDGDITADIVTGGLPVPTDVVGDYTVTYDVTDAAGNPAIQVTRTVHVVDTTKPVITRSGDAEVTVEVHGSYTDAGATAEDNYDGDITADIVTNGLPVDTSVVGNYTVTYDVTDAAGNPADQVVRTVHVVDTTKPVITRSGDASVTVEVDGTYTDAGATAEDNYDGNITADIVTGGLPVDTSVVGNYTVTYDVTDAAGNPADQVTRVVHVVDVAKPVITRLGDAEVTVEVHGSYTDAGAAAEDNYDGNITADIVTGGLPVDTSVVGNYTVTYDVTDAAGNPATQVTRLVHVVDTTKPVITRSGAAEVTVEVHGSYTDAGAAAEDNYDGDITANIVTGGLPVDTSVLGDYTVTYDVSDAAGNPADRVSRTVHVVDTTKPVITRSGAADVTVEVDGTYTDAGATAEDNYDGDITADIVTGGLPVDTSVVGNYTVTYDVTDAAGNPADRVTRTVHVVEDVLYLNAFSDGATLYVSSSAGPVPMIYTVTAPPGTQSVTYTDPTVPASALTLTEPPYKFVTHIDPYWMATGEWTIIMTALLADNSEISTSVTFTLAHAPANSDIDANGIPDNPFELLEDGDLWLNLSYVHETHSARMTAVRRVEAATVKERVRVDVEGWPFDGAGATVSVPGGVLEAGETGIVIVSTAPDLYALLGAEMAEAPDDYVPAEGGLYTEVSVLTSPDGVNYQELPDQTLAANPVEIDLTLPSDADASTGLYSHATEILSDPSSGLYIAPFGDGWSTENVIDAVIEGAGISANLTSLSLIAPFELYAGEGEGEGEGEGTGEGEGEGEGEPPFACLGVEQAAGKTTAADLAPLALVLGGMMLSRLVRGKRN